MLKDETALQIVTCLIISSPVLIVPSPALITLFLGILTFNSSPVNRFSNKLASNVPNNVLRNPTFCYFASFLIVLPTRFINKPDFSTNLTIFMISFVSSFEIINVVIPEPKMFF